MNNPMLLSEQWEDFLQHNKLKFLLDLPEEVLEKISCYKLSKFRITVDEGLFEPDIGDGIFVTYELHFIYLKGNSGQWETVVISVGDDFDACVQGNDGGSTQLSDFFSLEKSHSNYLDDCLLVFAKGLSF